MRVLEPHSHHTAQCRPSAPAGGSLVGLGRARQGSAAVHSSSRWLGLSWECLRLPTEEAGAPALLAEEPGLADHQRPAATLALSAPLARPHSSPLPKRFPHRLMDTTAMGPIESSFPPGPAHFPEASPAPKAHPSQQRSRWPTGGTSLEKTTEQQCWGHVCRHLVVSRAP